MAPRILVLGLVCAILLGGSFAAAQVNEFGGAPLNSATTAARPDVTDIDAVFTPGSPAFISTDAAYSPPGQTVTPDVRTPVMAGNACDCVPTAPLDSSCLHGRTDCFSTTDWAKVPPVRVFPRPGNFFIPPTGPGYFSLMDLVHGEQRKAPQPSGYPAFAIIAPPFYDTDFRYLDKIPMEDRRWFERLKRIHMGNDFLFSTGGEAWYRFHNEINSRLTERDNRFGLSRARVYGDLWYRDQVRVYAEFITANRAGGQLPPLGIDVDHADLLNLFADVKLFELADHPVYVRAGRQEVLLGSQRLLSPLPWGNMRRNFDGVRAFRQGANFDVDLFWLRPVVINPTQFDSPNQNQQLAGAWFTYRPKKGTFVDLYYMYFENQSTVMQQGIALAPEHINTLGFRYAGDQNDFLWDVETALQLGHRGSADVVAGMVTTGAGYHFSNVAWNPTLWVYYDYASGDANPNAGSFNTFNQLFPFGHYYLGWVDAVGRQNIQDVNLHLGLYPMPWITVWLQYHHFWLANGRDALYNAGGAAIRRDPTGNSGKDVGDEFDIVVNFHIDANSDILVSYAQLWGGGFLESTAGANAAPTSEALYLLYNFRW